MGEQYVDLFAAGAYAMEARLFQALAHPSIAWIFYVLAGSGVAVSILQSALEGAVQSFLRHLATVAVASVLIVMPHRFELSQLTYAAPGMIESLFGTRVGAAPHLTYLVERLGAAVALSLHNLMHSQPVFTVPSVASQVQDLTSNPALLQDAQLKANLHAWRNYIVPRLLNLDPNLATSIRMGDLLSALLNPAPAEVAWVGSEASRRALAVRSLLESSRLDLVTIVADESPLLRQVSGAAGADPWIVGSSSVRLRLALDSAPMIPPPMSSSPGYDDALSRGTALARAMIDLLPQGPAPVDVVRIDELHDLLGRSILYAAGVGYMRDHRRLATLGSFCQRLGSVACRAAQAPLIGTSAALRVPESDRYNTVSFITWLKQPLSTLLLAVASLLLGTLSALVVAVLPFLLGVAKAIAILMSGVGLWMMLWPGRLRDAISWMILPVAFVALWSLLFNLWADVETFLSAIGSIVGHSDYGSFSAGRIMSIAISVGYLGLPAVALSILSGSGLRALDHASARLETALLMAWRARRAAVSFGRRWLTSSPLARRWNQRVYRAVGLGTLRRARATTQSTKRAVPPAVSRRAPKTPGGVRPARTGDPPEDFKLE